MYDIIHIQDSQSMYNLALRRFRVIIDAVGEP